MSIDKLLTEYDPNTILSAADRIKTTKDMIEKLAGSQWEGVHLNFGGDTYILPGFEGLRPLALSIHVFGLWVEPIYTSPPSGTAEKAFALHVSETEAGLKIYIEDAFKIIVTGNYELGFVLKTELKENTSIQTERIKKK